MVIQSRDDLSRLIKGAAALQGVSVSELARRLGVLQPSISRTINRVDIPLSMLMKIAGALGCRLSVDLLPIDPPGAASPGDGVEE